MLPAPGPERSDPGRTVWRRLWEGWKAIAKRVGDVQARVLLAVFYVIVLAPFALLVRLTSDPLAIGPRGRRGWQRRVEAPGTILEQARRQF